MFGISVAAGGGENLDLEVPCGSSGSVTWGDDVDQPCSNKGLSFIYKYTCILQMGVSKNRGGPPKWMVKIMENPIKMDDLGVPLFLETPIYIYISLYIYPFLNGKIEKPFIVSYS